ncbi:hypothetical protein [Leuconostoc citreum]
MTNKRIKTMAIESNLLDLLHVKYALTSTPLNFKDYLLKVLGQAKLKQSKGAKSVGSSDDKIIPITIQVDDDNWLCDATTSEVNQLLASQLTEFQVGNVANSWLKSKIYPVANRFMKKFRFFNKNGQTSDDQSLISLKEIVHQKAKQQRRLEVVVCLIGSLVTIVLEVLLLTKLGHLFSEVIKQQSLEKLYQVLITPLPVLTLVTTLFMLLGFLIVKQSWVSKHLQNFLTMLDFSIVSIFLLHYVLLTSLTSFSVLQQISRFVLQSIALLVSIQIITILVISLVSFVSLDRINYANVVDLMKNHSVNLALIYNQRNTHHYVSLNHCLIVNNGLVANGLLDDTKLIYASLSGSEQQIDELVPAKEA